MTEATNLHALPQGFPTKPVRLIEPFGAGGGPDLLAHALAQKLSAVWSQGVSVENLSGAGATAGPAMVAQSPADGYTLLLNTSAQAYSTALLKKLPYDPLKDFTPIAALASQPYVLVAGKRAGVTTVGALITTAKATPREFKYGSSGIATGTHLGLEKFNLAAGIRAVHVLPSPSDAIVDIIGRTIAGGTDYMLAPIPLALHFIRDGSLVPLGVSSSRRSSLLPEVPTIMEAGVAGFDFPIWYGLWAPAGTPAAVVEKITKDIARVLAAPDVGAWLAEHGSEPMKITQLEFARFVLTESESAAQIMRAAGFKSE